MASDPTPTDHLDSLALDLVRTGEGSPADTVHLEGCAECREALAEIEAIAGRFRPRFPAPVDVPAEIEQRILWNARKRALELRRTPVRRVLLQPGWAVAAVVVLAFGVATFWRQAILAPSSAPPQRIARADIDGDGNVDMIDALRLARAVRGGGSLDPAWDVNGDGHVDELDTDAVAMRAVSIGGA
jgi:anti-sigma factor RsiW